jgi:hypothetical protein
MSYTALLFTPHPTLSPAPSSPLSLPHPTYPGVAASLPGSYSASHGGPAAEEVARRGGWPARGNRRRRRGCLGSSVVPESSNLVGRRSAVAAPAQIEPPQGQRRWSSLTPHRCAAQSSHPKVGGSSRGGPRPQVRRAAAGGLYLPGPPPSGGAVLSSSCGGGGLAGARGGGGLLCLSAESVRARVEAATGGAPATASLSAGEGRRGCWASLSLRPSGRRRHGALASPSHLPCDDRVVGDRAGVRGPHATSSGGVARYVRWEWGSTADTGPFHRS